MRRLLRILFGLLAGLSLLLCATSAAFWVRSYRTVDAWGVQKERRYVLGSWHGKLYLERQSQLWWLVFKPEKHLTPYAKRWELADNADLESTLWAEFEAYGAVHPGISGGSMTRHVLEVDYCAVPFWMVALTTAFAPAMWAFLLIRRRRRLSHRRRRGLCVHCGYDLRATPDPAGPLLPRCPECGRHSREREVAVVPPGP